MAQSAVAAVSLAVALINVPGGLCYTDFGGKGAKPRRSKLLNGLSLAPSLAIG